MGSVYRARRAHIGDEVAVKVLLRDFVKNADAIERFRREARAAAMLHHPNIVTIHDYGETAEADAPAYIVMELVTGSTMRDILEREGRFSTQRAVALMRSICAGVGAAHRNHIVHRDIKPDNIIVIPPHTEDEQETVKVLDFGIAKLRDMAGSAALTQTGMVVGTPYYMSPEQCKAERLDARSDVYSLGAMMYEMLAGCPPFDAETATGIVAKHLMEPPPPLPHALSIPQAVEAVILRALSKDPARRQPDATEFARELQHAFAMPQQGASPQETRQAFLPDQPFAPAPEYPQQHFDPTYHQPPAPVKSRAGLVAGIIAALLVLVGVGAGAWFLVGKDEIPQQNSNTIQANVNKPPPETRSGGTISPVEDDDSSKVEVTPYTPPIDRAALKKEVAAVLDDWARALGDGDLDAHMRFFADTLDTYYRSTNVPAQNVRRDIGRAFAIYSTFDVRLSNIEVTVGDEGTSATAVFDKEWEFTGEKYSSGSVQQMAWLEKRNGRWLITGIKDLKVYQVGK
jgi:serine/threonine-protein kinase